MSQPMGKHWYVLGVAAAVACAPRPVVRSVVVPQPILVEQVTAGPMIPPSPLEVVDQGQRITLVASNQDIRELLPILAQAAGVNLQIGSDVQGTVTVRFLNVPALQALYAVAELAGLSIDSPSRPTTRPNVFHQTAVNVNLAGSTSIAPRFDVSAKLAAFVVDSRPRR